MTTECSKRGQDLNIEYSAAVVRSKMPRQSRLEYDRRGHYWVSPVKNVLLSNEKKKRLNWPLSSRVLISSALTRTARWSSTGTFCSQYQPPRTTETLCSRAPSTFAGVSPIIYTLYSVGIRWLPERSLRSRI